MCKENCKCHKCCTPCNVVSGDNGCLNESLPLKCTHYSGSPIPSVGITQADNGDEVINKLVQAITSTPVNVSDKFVKISSVDSSSSYLSDKLKTKVGSTITITKKNSGLNEYLELDVPANPAETKFVGISSDGISYTLGGTNGHSPVYKVHLDPATDPALSLSAAGLKLNLPVNVETPLTVTDSATIDLTTSGINGHSLTASAKISSVSGNALVNNTGLFVPTVVNTPFVANNGQGIQATVGGTDGHSPVYSIKLDSTTDSALSLSNAGLKFTPVAEQSLVANDSTTIDFTTSGIKNHTISADVKLSTVTGNILTNNNGLYVPTPAAETQFVANDSSTIDFTTTGIKGHTLTGDVKISSVVGNSLVNNSGLFVPASTYTLPIATNTILGGVKVGTGLSIDSTTGVLSSVPVLTRFGIEDNLAAQDRTFKMLNNSFAFLLDDVATLDDSNNYISIYQKGFGVEINDNFGGSTTFGGSLTIEPGSCHMDSSSDTAQSVLNIFSNSISSGVTTNTGIFSTNFTIDGTIDTTFPIFKISQSNETNTSLNNTQTFAYGIQGDYFIPLSVNSNFADSAGNINIAPVEYADNAAAITGGLVAGQTYHTAGIVKVVLPAV